MAKKKPTYKEVEKRVRELEKEVKSQNKRFTEFIVDSDQAKRQLESFKSTADLLEINLDQNWRIIGHSNNFLLLTENIVGLRKKGVHIKELFQEKAVTKILQYLQKIDEITTVRLKVFK